MAAISPTALGSGAYTVSASRRLVADLSLDIVSTAPFTALQLRFPATATGVSVSLGRAGATLGLPVTVGTITDTTTFTNRRVIVRTSVIGSQLVVDWEIRATAMVAENEVWSVRAQAPAEYTWRFTQDDDSPGDPTITRLMCDPACGFSLSAPSSAAGTILEKDVVTLTAIAPTGTATAPTVVGSPLPTFSYRFDKTGALPVPGLPACSADPTLTLPLPGVTADQTIDFTHDVWFETDCSTVGFLTSTAPPQTVTIKWNPPWTLTTLTPGPLTLRPGEPSALRFEVGGRPGASANLGIEAPAPAGAWFSGLPTAVSPGPGPVEVPFTPAAGTPAGTSGTFVGVLTEPGTNRILVRSVPIPFEVRRNPPTGG